MKLISSLWHRAALMVLPLCFIGSPAFAEMAKPADAFVDTIGVQMHLDDTTSPYVTNFPALVSAFSSSGIRHIRDSFGGVAGSDAAKSLVSQVKTATGVDVKFLFTERFFCGITQGDVNPAQYLTWGWVPANIDGFEGLNEPVSYCGGGAAGATNARNGQIYLWNAVKGNATLAPLPVIGPGLFMSGGQAATTTDAGLIGDITAYIDQGNEHNYTNDAKPTANDSWLPHPALDAMNGTVKATWMSEMGYPQASPTYIPVAAATKYLSRSWFEYFNQGIVKTYIYEFANESQKAGSEGTFGIVNADGTAKPQFTMIKNLISLLKDPGAAFTPGDLPYTITGGTPQLHHTLLQKRNGVYYLALWLDYSSFDAFSPSSITVNFTGSRNVNRYDPIVSGTPQAVNSNVTALTFTVGDQATILEISPVGAPIPTASLTAAPASITAGGTSTLSWGSMNATSCTGTGFATAGAVSGSAAVSPAVTTPYSVSCTGTGGTASASATVTVTPASSGPVVYVAPSGADNGTCGAIATPCLTIGFAAGRAAPGNEVVIRAGSYDASTINTGGSAAAGKNWFHPYTGESVTINGGVSVFADYIKISGLMIANSTDVGLYVYEGGNIELTGNTIHDSFQAGILLEGNRTPATKVHDILLKGNIIYRNCKNNSVAPGTVVWGQGITVWPGQIAANDNITVDGNSVYENWGEGIGSVSSRGTIIKNNTVHDNYSAEIYNDGSPGAIIDRNLVYNTGSLGTIGPIEGLAAATERADGSLDAPVWTNNIVIAEKRGFYWFNQANLTGMTNALFANNTIARSTNESFRVDPYTQNSGNTYKNNVFFKIGGTQTSGEPKGTASNNCWYNTSAGPFAGAGDVTADPLLVNPATVAAADYKLKAGSPCAEAGMTLAQVTTDYFGAPRTVPYSIGAHELDASAPAPTASLTASPATIVSGGSSTLAWGSTNATSCTGTGFSTGTAISGSITVSPASTTAYSVTCTGATAPAATASATVTVTTAVPAPTASLTASPSTIVLGASSTLTWGSTNATSCTGTGFTAAGVSGSASVTPAAVGTSNYSVTCSGATAPAATASAAVTVNAAPPTSGFTVDSVPAGNILMLTGTSGTQWVNVACFRAVAPFTKVCPDAPPSGGRYTLSLDRTQLPDGANQIDVKGFSTPPGQPGTATTVTITVTR